MNIYNVRLCVRLLIQYSFRAKVITIWKSYDMYGWHVISSKGQWYPIRFMFFFISRMHLGANPMRVGVEFHFVYNPIKFCHKF